MTLKFYFSSQLALPCLSLLLPGLERACKIQRDALAGGLSGASGIGEDPACPPLPQRGTQQSHRKCEPPFLPAQASRTHIKCIKHKNTDAMSVLFFAIVILYKSPACRKQSLWNSHFSGEGLPHTSLVHNPLYFWGLKVGQYAYNVVKSNKVTWSFHGICCFN